MKKSVIVLFVLGMQAVSAQNESPKKDSVKVYKNEYGVNILPYINMLSLADNGYSRQSINYRRYINAKNALRVSIGYYPTKSNGYPQKEEFAFHTDTFLVYAREELKQTMTPQLNLGYEFIFRNRKVVQSFGGEMFVNYQHVEKKSNFYRTGQNQVVGDDVLSYANVVDTLGGTNVSDRIGVGLHMFYNIRILIGKHMLLSSTFGPSIQYINDRNSNTDRKTGQVTRNTIANLDFQLYLSDISIAYRF